ncbi:MAG: hypothetical protein M1823_006788, partial [Watsoniomyces obsoletus]
MPDAPSVRQSRTTTQELQERKHMLDLRDLDIHRREQALLHKERETVLREREAAVQERHTRLREREKDLESKARQHNTNARTSESFSRQCSEMATFLGSQFASLQAQLREVSKFMPMPPGSNEVDNDINLSDSADFRSHAGKRKASGKARAGSNASPGRPSRPSLKPVARPDPDTPDEDDEEGETGTPKKMKIDPESATSPGKLYACHYCKHDSS